MSRRLPQKEHIFLFNRKKHNENIEGLRDLLSISQRIMHYNCIERNVVG